MVPFDGKPGCKEGNNASVGESVLRSPPGSPSLNGKSSGSGSSGSPTFSWRKLRREQGDLDYDGGDTGSGSMSPRLWRPGSSFYSSEMSERAQEIALGRQEMLKLCEGMPESTYELSLKDLVEHKAALDQDSHNYVKDKSVPKKSRNGSEESRKKDENQRRVLLNIFVPGRLSVFPHSSPSPLRTVEQSHETPRKDLSREAKARKGAAASARALLSLLRHVRASKNSARASSSDSSSHGRTHSQSGKDEPSDPVGFSGSPHEGRSGSSNRCSLCSGYTLFLKTKCQVCGKVYCSICEKVATVMTTDGPRCQEKCANRFKLDSDSEQSLKSCWPGLRGSIVSHRRKSSTSFDKETPRRLSP
eukprot:TRINITY_DN1265_c0_g1_i1.p1 TRINITY_DN1265_c0_g1~~TRINITY_DN1265_c0_g1_i1.p1  ORF type:complete len:360 (+),score=45.91 TRINITY_DN1265_c0_g1_i1:208-1287(+)